MRYIDNLLERVSMYKLVIGLLGVILFYSSFLYDFGVVDFDRGVIALYVLFLFAIGLASHYIFNFIYKSPANVESTIITILLVACISRPDVSGEGLMSAGIIVFIAIASKYWLAYKNRHIFNPTAFALLAAGLVGYGSAAWWTSSKYVFPILLISLFLINRKIKKSSMLISFFVVTFICVIINSFFTGLSTDIFQELLSRIISWPTVFLAAFMLTEPLTTPPLKRQQVIYGALVGALSSLSYSVGVIHSSPELALIIGNVYAYAVSNKERLSLKLKNKLLIAKDTYEFIFEKAGGLKHVAGQYMEWTLLHDKPDNRGEKRYFTIASNPNSEEVRLGVKFTENGSSFKKALINMPIGGVVYAAHPTGDFILPENENKKLVFIAGGIGITPYISMIRDVISKNEKRDITLFYACKTKEELAYLDVIKEAEDKINLKLVTVLSDVSSIADTYDGESGFIDIEMIRRHVDNVTENKYYISGPHGMVESYKSMLLTAGVKRGDVVTDYFPGFV